MAEHVADASNSAPHLILVVEDEVDLLRAAVDSIEFLGFRALGAQSSAQALDILDRRSDIDVLFTDVRMPGEMNGVDLAFTVKSRWPAMGIIVVSGNFDPKATRLPIGASFLAKPYRLATVKTLIEQQIGPKSTRSAENLIR